MMVVIVFALLTNCVIALEVLPLKLLLPLYCAVIEWELTASADVVNVATPLPFSVLVPSELAPSLKVTVPAGVPCVEVTVAVKVIGSP